MPGCKPRKRPGCNLGLRCFVWNRVLMKNEALLSIIMFIQILWSQPRSFKTARMDDMFQSPLCCPSRLFLCLGDDQFAFQLHIYRCTILGHHQCCGYEGAITDSLQSTYNIIPWAVMRWFGFWNGHFVLADGDLSYSSLVGYFQLRKGVILRFFALPCSQTIQISLIEKGWDRKVRNSFISWTFRWWSILRAIRGLFLLGWFERHHDHFQSLVTTQMDSQVQEKRTADHILPPAFGCNKRVSSLRVFRFLRLYPALSDELHRWKLRLWSSLVLWWRSSYEGEGSPRANLGFLPLAFWMLGILWYLSPSRSNFFQPRLGYTCTRNSLVLCCCHSYPYLGIIACRKLNVWGCVFRDGNTYYARQSEFLTQNKSGVDEKRIYTDKKVNHEQLSKTIRRWLVLCSLTSIIWRAVPRCQTEQSHRLAPYHTSKDTCTCRANQIETFL